MPWDFVLILVVLGILVPWRGAARFRRLLTLGELRSADRLALYASTIAFQWLAAAIVAWRAYARQLDASALALQVPREFLAGSSAVLLSVAVVLFQLASLRRLARTPREKRGTLGAVTEKLMPRDTVERLAFVALAATAALCEEFLYRGFVYAAFERATGGSAVAAVIASAVFFALAHLYQGAQGLRATFVVGLILGAVRSITASLVPCIAAHFFADLTAGLAARPILARQTQATAQQTTSFASQSAEGMQRGDGEGHQNNSTKE